VDSAADEKNRLTVMSDIHVFHHAAMATHIQVRMASEDKKYAAQVAQTAFDLIDKLEARLTRFRVTSEISQIAALAPGETMNLSDAAFDCLTVAQRMAQATKNAFSISAAALQTQPQPPGWTLLNYAIRCDSGKTQFDLGAIGKGFALDCVSGLLREWDCPAFLLVAGGSSIVAGEPPPGMKGWSCGLGDDNSAQRYWLKNVSLSGSGLAVKGQHILDPRTGQPAQRQNRTWALCDTGAESDALSTACMVLAEQEIVEILAAEKSWLVFLDENGNARPLGGRALPEPA
jgi:thiamine biosynthesis lipoprotein